MDIRGATITVLTADGQPLFRDALARVIRQHARLALVAEAADGPAALEAIDRLRPRVAVVSHALERIDGERIVRAVRRDGLPTRVVLLADPTEPRRAAYEAIESGAAACISRAASADQLCDAIVAAGTGDVYFGRELHRGLAREIRLRSERAHPVLTSREREVLRLVAGGLTTAGIAAQVHLAPATVKTHLAHVYEKLGVSERAAAVAEAMRRELLE